LDIRNDASIWNSRWQASITNSALTSGRLVMQPLIPANGPCLASSTRLTDLSAPTSLMNRLRLTGTFPATAFSALATCSSIPRSVRRA
jgi:hypothetical protein